MKQNSKNPTTTTTPSKGGNRPSMQHGHHQQTSMIHQQQMQPGSVVYHQQQQQPSYSSPQHQQQSGCIVLPSSTPMHHQHQTHQTYMPQQPGQLVSVGTTGAPMYIGGTVMGHQTAEQASPAGFSTSGQQQTSPPPVRYLQTVQHHPSMSQQQVQRSNFQQPTTVTDFVTGSSVGPAAVSFTGAHQQYKQQQQQHHQHQVQPMQSYQEAPTSSYPVHVQSSLHPEGPTTTEAQYFFDANCTMPVVQQPNPATLTGCRNPSCTSCKSFKRN